MKSEWIHEFTMENYIYILRYINNCVDFEQTWSLNKH